MNSNFRGRDFCILQVNEAKFKHFERYYAAPENEQGSKPFFWYSVCQSKHLSEDDVVRDKYPSIFPNHHWGKVIRKMVRGESFKEFY